MTLDIVLIRHGQICRDGERRLVGITDEPIGKEGKQMILERRKAGYYPDVDIVYSSDLKRCARTARLAYYRRTMVIVERGFRAPDYGDFDGRAFSELRNDEAFREWQTSEVMKACPNGETPDEFSSRVLKTFKKACLGAVSSGFSSLAIVSHRTVIGEILKRYYTPRSTYKYWEIPPGGRYLLKYDTETSQIFGRF